MNRGCASQGMCLGKARCVHVCQHGQVTQYVVFFDCCVWVTTSIFELVVFLETLWCPWGCILAHFLMPEGSFWLTFEPWVVPGEPFLLPFGLLRVPGEAIWFSGGGPGYILVPT